MSVPTLTQLFTDIANSIRAKKNISASQTIQATNFPTMINSIPTSLIKEKGVDFIDYDGTLLYSYTPAEVQLLTELPPLPSHQGLICQGWNWTLADLKTLNDKMTVGALYITDDNKTRLYIHIPDDGRLSLSLEYMQSVIDGTAIDWGDGSAIETSSDNTAPVIKNHTYQNPGDYVITLLPSQNCDLMLGTSNTQAYLLTGGIIQTDYSIPCRLVKIELGRNVSIGQYPIQYSKMLTSITVTQNTDMSDTLFSNCNALKGIVIPATCSTIVKDKFNSCNSLRRISLPNNLGAINQNAFRGCRSLISVNIPATAFLNSTNIFRDCNSLKEFKFYGNNIPAYSCQDCTVLSKVIISEGVEKLNTYCFSGCATITDVVFPSTLTNIYAGVFQNCTSLLRYDFRALEAVPALSSTDAIGGSSLYNWQIVVPDDLYEDWIVAANWSNFASRTVKASEA